MINYFRKAEKGFTLIELMVVIGIISLLAMIAIPQFSAYRIRAYNVSQKSDLKNAYTAAHAFFSENPTGTLGVGVVNELHTLQGMYGFRTSPDVTITITVDKNLITTLEMTSTHASSTASYTINSEGVIS